MWERFRRRRENELDKELRFHIEQQVKDYIDEGLSPEAAGRRARLEFGRVMQIKEACRDAWPMRWFSGFLEDLRIASRLFRRNPSFTFVCVLTLGLGIAANTTVFTVANALVLKGLPFEDPDRVVHIYEFDRSKGPDSQSSGVSYPDFLDFREQTRSFSGLAMYGVGTYNISDEVSTPERVEGSRITPGLFSVIGFQPLRGRSFIDGEDRPGSAPVVIISHGLWETRYGGVPDIVGRSLRSNGVAHTIVGVMPAGMKFPLRSEIWLPRTASTEPSDRSMREGSDVIARLRDGISISEARAELQKIAEQLRSEYPGTNRDIGVTLIPFLDRFNDPANVPVFAALFGSVTFVLLIVCANLASLMLARAVRRTRETAIRMAVGASRWQVIREFLTESVILSFLGGCLGFGLASIAVYWIAGEMTGVGLPYWTDFSIDYRVVLQLVTVCFLTAGLVGAAPALQAARTDIQSRLNEGAFGLGASRRTRTLTSLLITMEIALTFTLLVGAGLMIRNFLNFQLRDTGIRTEDMLTATLILPATTYPEASDRIRFEQDLMARLEAQPGLRPVTLASHAPLTGALRRTIRIDGLLLDSVRVLSVAPGYFDAVGIGIRRGRGFRGNEGTPANGAAIVNELFVAQHWPDEEAVGQRLRFGDGPQAPSLSVVGVVRDISVAIDIEPIVYVPYSQEPVRIVEIVSRSSLPRDAAVRALRSSVQAMDPNLPLSRIRTVDEFLWRLSVGNRVLGSLFSVFALIALVMSLVGIYGVTAYSVSQRSREIGIRMALGASGRSVLWLVAGRGIWQSVIGLTVGLAGAWAVGRIIFSRMMSGLPGQISSTDTLTFLVVPVFLAFVTLIACLGPARHVAKADPAVALRVH